MRPIPSASAISVTVAPEASAFAIRASRPSRRSSAVGLGCASSVIGVLRLLTRANRREETTRVWFSAIAVPFPTSGFADYPNGIGAPAFGTQANTPALSLTRRPTLVPESSRAFRCLMQRLWSQQGSQCRHR